MEGEGRERQRDRERDRHRERESTRSKPPCFVPVWGGEENKRGENQLSGCPTEMKRKKGCPTEEKKRKKKKRGKPIVRLSDGAPGHGVTRGIKF